MRTVLLYVLCAVMLASCGMETPVNVAKSDALPSIYPDYAGVTIPVGIAPLNFNVDGADCVYATAKGSISGEISAGGEWVDFDIEEWKSLLSANSGGNISVAVSAKSNGQWTEYQPFLIYVSSDPLSEYGLTYRRILPGYETYSNLGIYQRDLHSFDEFTIVGHTALPGECMNCHVANKCNPDQFQLHIRGKHSATLIQQNGERTLLNTRSDSTVANCMYAYWHPSGKYCAYGIGDVAQCFWEDHARNIIVADKVSEIAILEMSTNNLILPKIFRNKSLLQYPSFSPKGDSLYFCVAKALPDTAFWSDTQYDLCAVSFDAGNGVVGEEVDTLFAATAINKSVAHPKPSYDGRFIIFSLADCSVFPIHLQSSDIYILDLSTRQVRPLSEINSPKADSYTNWSTNSRWIVFTSRRQTDVNTLLYIAHIDSDGNAGKPFLLPQRNPREYYHKMMHSYNVPDFTTQKVDLDIRAFADEIFNEPRIKVGVRK